MFVLSAAHPGFSGRRRVVAFQLFQQFAFGNLQHLRRPLKVSPRQLEDVFQKTPLESRQGPTEIEWTSSRVLLFSIVHVFLLLYRTPCGTGFSGGAGRERFEVGNADGDFHKEAETLG